MLVRYDLQPSVLLLKAEEPFACHERLFFSQKEFFGGGQEGTAHLLVRDRKKGNDP
jgi:hypothetical protein